MRSQRKKKSLGMQVTLFVISTPPKLIILQVRRFSADIIAPNVRDMDEKEAMAPGIIKALFDQGVRFNLPLMSQHSIFCPAHGY